MALKIAGASAPSRMAWRYALSRHQALRYIYDVLANKTQTTYRRRAGECLAKKSWRISHEQQQRDAVGCIGCGCHNLIS